VPNCISYDPTFGYEVAVIIQEGLRRMLTEQEDVYYYITLMNENYVQPPMPDGAAADLIKGMYLFRKGEAQASDAPRVQLLGSGTILREVIAAADLLASDWGVAADVWSCPSFTELARDGYATTRWNTLNPSAPARTSHVERCLQATQGPVVAATDYIRAFAEQIRAWVPRRYAVLGTDGFGRSDTREKLRAFFEVDRRYVTVAALKALADEKGVSDATVAAAVEKYAIDSAKPAPWTV
jgi:pyruvate dehydrogenase E1 component